MSLVRFGVSLVLCTLVGVMSCSARADAGMLCGRAGPVNGLVRDGATIKIREICRDNEVQLDPVELGLQGPKGDTGAQGLQGPSGPAGVPGPPGPGSAVVKDSNGLTLGPILELGRVLMAVGDGRVAIVNLNRIGIPRGGQVFYTSTDCSGVPLMLDDDLLPPQGAVQEDTLFVPSGSEPSMLLVRSLRDTGGPPCDSLGTPELLNVVPATVRDLSTFTPPFVVVSE